MSSEDVVEEFICTREQAFALVRKSDREKARWCLSVRLDAMVEGKPDSLFSDAICTYMNVSRKEATRIVSTAMTDTLEARGARIRVVKRTGTYGTTYWITQ